MSGKRSVTPLRRERANDLARRLEGYSDRNPPARRPDFQRAWTVVQAVSKRLVNDGARAVVLAGSWARGDAHRESDIDLWAFGRRRSGRILQRDGFMVTIRRVTESSEQRELREFPDLGGAIPGWRIAIPIHDPSGIARRFKRQARRFRWEAVEVRRKRWSVLEMLNLAEEVLKLSRGIAARRWESAAGHRNAIVNGLSYVIGAKRRIWYGSENDFWERLRKSGPKNWKRVQGVALGVESGGISVTCTGALELYSLAARELSDDFSQEHWAIVVRACEVAGFPLD